MSLYSLEHLTKSTQWGGMILTIFDTRYGDGLCVILTKTIEHAAAIEDKSSGPYDEWEVLHNPLPTLGWFPIVFVKNIDDAIPAMRAKLKKIEEKNPDISQWHSSVGWICSLIEENKHVDLLNCLRGENPFTDVENAYNLLCDYF